MYDLPEVRDATHRWWAGLAGHLRTAGFSAAPDMLGHPSDPARVWHDPELLLSQTCGYPLIHALAGKLAVLGTPCYRAPGCAGSDYASALVVAADSPATDLAAMRGARCVFNAFDSHSGYNVLRAMIAPLAGGRRFFSSVEPSGSHIASIAAVGDARADLCAVDTVTHALLARERPRILDGTRVLGFSPRAPGLPYVCAATWSTAERARIADAVIRAFADARLADARRRLLLAGFDVDTGDRYHAVAAFERAAVDGGYPRLA